MIYICVNAAVYHMHHINKQECCSEFNTLTDFYKPVHSKKLASSTY